MFSDATDPLRRLTNPEEHSESILGQPFSNVSVALDWLSPSHVVNELVKQTTGHDVFGEAAAAFAGDWELVWQCAGAFRNLAGALQDLGINLSCGNVELDLSWDGNAADAAFTYFAGLSAAVSEQQVPLNELAKAYETAAEGTYRLMEGVSGILKDISDAAMIAALAAYAGTASFGTGVGAVTGWGIAAYEAYRIATLTERARKLIATGSAIVSGATGYVQSAAADVDVLAQHRLPQSAYHHPGTALP
ncbi:hypothetical protein AB0F81_04150 [Actinoplanes sp. NPDC024001]|uniref:hypothetical protein n=1 Tax=Actinoplanes sp. NPDC024001 TaxID=3154598 RepID=UPI0033FB2BF3